MEQIVPSVSCQQEDDNDTGETKSGRKSLPEYEINPSLPVASKNAKIGQRRITNKAGDKMMIVTESGEISPLLASTKSLTLTRPNSSNFSSVALKWSTT